MSFAPPALKPTGLTVLIILASALMIAVPSATRAEQGFTSAAVSHNDVDNKELILREFQKFDANYVAHHKRFGDWLLRITENLADAKRRGEHLPCSEQMFLEAKWLHRYTAHFDRLEDALHRIEISLSQKSQEYADEQDPTDGLYGRCFTEHFMRLAATLDAAETLAARGQAPPYKMRNKGIFDTGKKVLNQFQDLLISDIATTGINTRAQLNSLVTTFSQVAFKPHLRNIAISMTAYEQPKQLARILEAFRFFVNGAQNRETGYWGAWYLVDGKIIKTNDLSITYHVISYTKGAVDHWPEIMATTEKIKDEPYPYGWVHNGRHNNHNLYDVVKIYKFGWPYMTEQQRGRTRKELAWMLEWSLENTLLPDGAFKFDPTFSSSLAGAYYFGVSFYDAIGYWEKEHNFWSDEPVSRKAEDMYCRVRRNLEALGLNGWASISAHRKLVRNCATCTCPT